MAGLGDRAAAKAIHRDASPGLRLRTRAHSPLPPPSRTEATAPASSPTVDRVDTPEKKKKRESTHSLLTNTRHPPKPLHASPPCPASAFRVTGASQCPGHKTASARTYEKGGRAGARGARRSFPACSLPSSRRFRAPAHPVPFLLATPARGGSSPLPSPSLPIGQTVGRAPPLYWLQPRTPSCSSLPIGWDRGPRDPSW